MGPGPSFLPERLRTKIRPGRYPRTAANQDGRQDGRQDAEGPLPEAQLGLS